MWFRKSTVYMIFRSPRDRNTVSNEGVGEIVGGDRGRGEEVKKRKRRRGKEEEQNREEEKESFWCL